MAETTTTLLDKLLGHWAEPDRAVMLSDLQPTFSELAEEYNHSIADEPLMISVKRLQSPARLMVTNSLWTLSIRVSATAIECFLLPSAELTALMEAEQPSRCKLRFVFEESGFSVDGAPINNHELGTLLRSLLKDVIVRSQGEFEQLPVSARLVLGGQSLTGSVRSIVAEKHVLVQKIVNQQEAILAQIARELHDAVLGNMMVLERSLSGGKQLSNSEMMSIVRESATQLREICHDLYPRDLKDCGLPPMLEELCRRLEERIGCKCNFICSDNLPELPDEVLLHVYRIAQECCNNVAKHSAASSVEISLTYKDGSLSLWIEDNGKGFDPDSAARSGIGSSSIKERTELIDLIFPATLLVNSKPDQGTKVTLQIRT